MTPTYLASFITEMRSYIADLRNQAIIFASPTRSGENGARALRIMQRLGHTIAGVAKTVEVDDFVLLGEGLEATLGIFLRDEVVPSGTMVAPLTRLTVFFELRVNAFERLKQLVVASSEEETEAKRILATLRSHLPATPAAPAPPPSHQAFHLLDDDAIGLDPDALDDDIDFDGLANLPPEARAVIAAFLRTDLRQSRSTAAPQPMPMADPEVLREFVDEVADAIPPMHRALVEAQVPEQRGEALRMLDELAHRVKGAAFTVGFVAISTVANMLEMVLKSIRRGRLQLSGATLQWLIAGVDTLEALHDELRATGSDNGSPEMLAWLHEQYVAILAAASSVQRAPTLPEVPGGGADGPGAPQPPATTMRVATRQVDQLLATINSQQLNRVEMERLRHLGQASERDLTRIVQRLRQLEQRLRDERREQLHPQLDEAARQARQGQEITMSAMLARANQAADSEFLQLMTMLGEVVADLSSTDLDLQTALNQLGRQGEYHDYLTELAQRDVLALRLVPFVELLARLQLTLRTTAIAEGKEVSLVVTGETIEMDRDVSAALLDPLTQLVRNAVVHGIEPPAERAAAGKTERATVTIHTARSEDAVIIDVTDDGRGINARQLVLAAQFTRGPDDRPLLDAAQATRLSLPEALDLVFMPDLSTVVEVRPTAGHGMGLPAVKRAVTAVRGKITVKSEPGLGTTFQLRVPVSLGMLQGYTLFNGELGYVVPTDDVQGITALPEGALQAINGRLTVHLPDQSSTGGVNAPQHRIAALSLGMLVDRPDIPASGDHAVLLNLDGTQVAIIGDMGPDPKAETVVVRQVPALLRRRGIRQASVTTRGELRLVIDAPALARRALRRDMPTTLSTSQLIEPEQVDRILVVDDSPSIQRGLFQTLTAEGYTVQQARTGQEAMQALQLIIPRLIILDVEMPELNGFEVLQTMRRDRRYDDIPVIMLTSRAAVVYQEQAQQLGVFAYLTKPTGAEELLGTVAAALAVPTP